MDIFLTGSTGAIGSYLLDALIAQGGYQLYVLVRDPGKLPPRHLQSGRIQVLQGSLEHLGQHRELLARMDCIFHCAACWGGPQALAVNAEATLELFAALDSQHTRFFYFSTASILDGQYQLLPQASQIGTEYIRSKALCHERLQSAPYWERMTVLYPTVVLGGDPEHPWTHAALGLQRAKSWIPWLRWLKADGCFHFIHAADIAAICLHLLQCEKGGQRLVLGNAAVEVNEAMAELAAFFEQKIRFQIDLKPWLPLLKRALHPAMSDWDRFCLDNRSVRYQVVNSETYGLPSAGQTLTQILEWAG